MSLNMDNATNARNINQIKTLGNNYANDVKAVVNAMKGDKYTNLKSTIKNYWQGVDCDNFIKQLENKIAELQKEINSCTNLISDALNQELANYQKFQQGNKF